jgi:DNA invertase Pin-like site-specific DNA recombinase
VINAGGLRFAFYGRMSTHDRQDRASSRGWQRTAAEELTAGHGLIVAEYFDVGQSRRTPWRHRPQAAALLAAIADPYRGFDAIVVGEYERAFDSGQLRALAPVLDAYGVQLWLPETEGRLDPGSPVHQALMILLGSQSRREVARARYRVTTAMRMQARDQGRYLGGRPPYGYRLVDAGPHPNAAHARWGRQLHRLEPDPATAPHVRRIFAQRLAGRSIAAIARGLNDAGIACPGAADRDRNPHRTRQAWTLGTVAAILANPRYTGRQIWNRQRTERAGAQSTTGKPSTRRWNPVNEWAVSRRSVHVGLVSEEDFIAIQGLRAARPAQHGATRRYLLTGLLRCGVCDRRMDAHWVNNRPGYRCRHGHSSATGRADDGPRILYIREDHALTRLTSELGHLGSDPHELIDYLRSAEITITCDPTWANARKRRSRRPDLTRH